MKSYVIGYIVLGVVALLAIVVAFQTGRRSGRRSLQQRLTALSNRLGVEAPDDVGMEPVLSHLEKVAGDAAEAVTEASSDAIRLRRALDTLAQGVIVCDENGEVAFRNARAVALMSNRHGDALAAQAVTELLENAWQEGTAERTLDLYGPPRQTLTVRTRLIDDGRRPLGVIAIIEDVSERRRLEEIRRDFVANVSHELKTPIGALGLLAETLTVEPDSEVAQRLASRIHAEAFRVSRIIDDLLDLSRIESEEAPPREPISVNLVMAEAVERVRSAAEQRRISIELDEPDPPVHVVGDRRQLVSAIHSLLENAVTFSYEDSHRDRVAGPGRRRDPTLGRRHRRRHPHPRPRAHLRALLPGRPRPQPIDRGHRPRSVHRPPRGQQPPGPGRGGLAGGRGVDLHAGAPEPARVHGLTEESANRWPRHDS